MRHIPQLLSSRSQEACSEPKFPKKVTAMLKTAKLTLDWNTCKILECYELKSQIAYGYLKSLEMTFVTHSFS